MNIDTLTGMPRRALSSEKRTFGVRSSDVMLGSMILISLGTGPWADTASLSELLHPHVLFSMGMAVGTTVVAWHGGKARREKH